MTDSTTARLIDARTLLVRAAVELPECEAKHSIHLALAACGDALDAYGKDKSDD